MAGNRVIVLEFNELTPSLIDRFIGEGELPNFARFRSESRVFTTLADERPPELEPWIQWVTVHSGLPYQEHKLFHLNEGHKLQAKRTWEVVSDAGHQVLVCGSMNIRNANGTRGFVLPDPWCTKVNPSPAELAPYFRFVQQNVLEHTNDQVGFGLKDYAEFLWFMVRRGLSTATVLTILRQLWDERRNDSRWKRVVLLDLLQFDLFVHYYRRLAPSFSTFFLNSTAHYQHAYWDSMEPEHFPASSHTEKTKFRDAIRFGYQKMDILIGKFLTLASESNATLVLCTALSQQPSPEYDQGGGAVFYRPRNFTDFAKAVGLTGQFTVQPVMTQQFYLEFANASDAGAAAKRLSSVSLGGSQMLMVEATEKRIFTGCRIYQKVAEGAEILVDGKRLPFHQLFYEMDTGKTGVHHPDGILWIRLPDRQHAATLAKVPLTAVAPTMLKLVGVSVPDQMSTSPLTVT